MLGAAVIVAGLAGCKPETYILHIQYTITHPSLVATYVPCLGLIDKSTLALEPTVICDKDVKDTASNLNGDVMDVVLTTDNPGETWGKGKMNSGNYAYVPLLQQDSALYRSDTYAFFDPKTSTDGAWLLTATFDPSDSKKVEGQVTLQSIALDLN